MLRVGVDIVEISRIRECVRKYGDRFLKRIFTSEELGFCLPRFDSSSRLAGRFAAKEAFRKAWGHSLGWREVEVVREDRIRQEAEGVDGVHRLHRFPE